MARGDDGGSVREVAGGLGGWCGVISETFINKGDFEIRIFWIQIEKYMCVYMCKYWWIIERLVLSQIADQIRRNEKLDSMP